ncbi:MAG: HAD-IIB family hydrolase [Brachybacterium sp.]|nr:HAD-IIB family hydrolase [Brachybacterium sp.]
MDQGDGALRRPRLVASDLDGTLLDAHGAITERTARAWAALGAAGIESVLVTARPPRWVDHLAALTGEHGIVICANGAFVYDVARRRILTDHGMPGALALTLMRDLRAEVEDIVFSVELAGGFRREDGYPPSTPAGVPTSALDEAVGPLAELREPVGKILARSADLHREEFHRRVVAVLGDRATLATSCSDGLAEISPVGVTKAAALAAWTERSGIAAQDVWAFGDMPNDIPMLRWAGTGWAVANADESVHALADRVTAANTEDGVACAIEAMLAG